MKLGIRNSPVQLWSRATANVLISLLAQENVLRTVSMIVDGVTSVLSTLDGGGHLQNVGQGLFDWPGVLGPDERP